ncbi:MAG: DNA repair protein [Intestinibacter sp.]|uniref:DNA repair protein n=1 Tax=Intestinibacter sp. TaxID=1965304 RepID=UPI003F18C9AB
MRKLNGFYAIEVLNGRLNGSAAQVENKSGYDNATFTKKVAGRSKISSQCQKYNLKDFMSSMSGSSQSERIKEGKQIKAIVDPFKYELDDIFGFMLADKVEINEEEYELLNEGQKKLFKKTKNKYQANITKKRKSRLQMNALVNVSNRKVEWEWSVASSSTHFVPYQQEVYSGIHTSIFNLNIDDIGKFIVSDSATEFRDYSVEEANESNVRDLTEDERFDRVNNVLNAIEHLSISSNQANHLTDTKPKFIILADYSWGNNAFQGVLKKDGLDIEMLKECIDQNEKYRLSKIYIGVNKFFDDTFNNIKEELEKDFELCDFIEISNVQTAFENYKKELKSNIK